MYRCYVINMKLSCLNKKKKQLLREVKLLKKKDLIFYLGDYEMPPTTTKGSVTSGN